jgi:hypothetical protein
MLLVVVGLLVLVLVILVVVFLSVRSMRDAEEDGYEDRPAPRRPSRGRRDDDEDARPRGASRGRQPRSSGRRGPAGESWQNDRDAYAGSAADYEDDAGPAPREVPALPRPRRGDQHDQDRQEAPRRSARSQPRQAAGRIASGARDRAGKDWSGTDWGGVSDEQYWAELSSDKPLATTARSAQPASADRVATTATTAKLSVPGEPPTASGTPAATFGLRSESGGDGPATAAWGPAEPRTFGDPLSTQSHSRLAGRPPGAESSDTDPGLGGQAGWGRADDSISTAAWTAAGTGTGAAPDWAPQQSQDGSWDVPGQSMASGTSWRGPDESAPAAWTAQDAAVGSGATWADEPSVALGANWADEPSAADWGEPEQPSPAWNGNHATPAWNDDEQPAGSWNSPPDPLTSSSFPAASGYAADGAAFAGDSRSYRRSYDRARAQYESSPDVFGGAQPDYAGSHSNGNGYSASWPGSGNGYSHGSHDQLEPLPEPGGSAAASGSWHSAPVSASDSRFYAEPAAQPWEPAQDGYDGAARHRSGRQSQDDSYSSQDYRDWQDPETGYQQSAGYKPSHGQGHSNGYGQGHTNGYGQGHPDYEPGYSGPAGYGADHSDGSYGSNGHSNGYDLPAPGSGPAVNGYGHGQHSGYDNDRWQ